MMSFIIEFGEEPVRCQPVPTRTSVPERSPVRASSYRAESLELGNYSHHCRVRRLNALREPRVDIAMEIGPDHPSRYTVAGHDIREMVPQEPRIVPNQVYGSVPPQHNLPPQAYLPPHSQAYPKPQVREYTSQDQSSLTEANVLTLLEKLINIQQATEQVLKTIATRQNQAIVFSNVENSVPTFAGNSTQAKAQAWLNSVNNAALSLNMPVESKLNFCEQYLTGAAKFWYDRVVEQKTVTTWPEFEEAFKRTYCKRVSKDMLYRQMLTVMQYKEESLEVYFQKKASLCVQCNLEFADAKHAIIEGLTDTSLANTLVAIKHSNFEEVWDSIQEYERMIRQRGGRAHKSARPTAKVTEEPESPPQIFIRHREQEKYAEFEKRLPAYNEKREPLCFNCQKYGHIGRYCNEADRRLPKKCTNCESEEHNSEECAMRQQEVNIIKTKIPSTRATFEHAALINDKYVLQGFIDSGSKCSIIRKSAAEFCQLSVQKSNIELVGFGSERVGTKILGTTRAKVEVNKAAVELTLFVVKDSAMSHDLLIGETFLNDKLVAFVKIEDKFVIGRADREPFTRVKLPVNEQVQQPAKERITKTMKVRKHQEELDEATKSEVTSFVKELCVELHTKCNAVEELSAKVAEQQSQLQATLKAKLEAEAEVASVKAECEALRSEKSWYKNQLAKVQAERSAAQQVTASAAAEWTRQTPDQETAKNQEELVSLCNQLMKNPVLVEESLQVASTKQDEHVRESADSYKTRRHHPARRRSRSRQKVDFE
jgi:hypothetical protein